MPGSVRALRGYWLGLEQDIAESEQWAAVQTAEKREKIRIRQVTEVHSNWNEEQRGKEGKFSFQLILDNGAEEYAIRPTSEDADVLMQLFERAETTYFDMERKELIFADLQLD
jgi:hypothetical protein